MIFGQNFLSLPWKLDNPNCHNLSWNESCRRHIWRNWTRHQRIYGLQRICIIGHYQNRWHIFKERINEKMRFVKNGCGIKVQLFWEGHKNLAQSSSRFWRNYVMSKPWGWLRQIFVALSEKLKFKVREQKLQFTRIDIGSNVYILTTIKVFRKNLVNLKNSKSISVPTCWRRFRIGY